MNFKRKLLLLFSILTLFIPNLVFAYSDKVILGGENIGITVNTKDILVVGFYKVGGKNINNKDIKIGDKIIKVNQNNIASVYDMSQKINKYVKDNKVDITLDRNGREINTTLTLQKENNTYKTGLFIKDKITGIGTLTYIDPENKTFASLGHEIIDKETGKIAEIKSGNIFKSEIVGNTKSTNTTTGEKNAVFDKNTVYGDIEKNTQTGIYGSYSSNIKNDKLIDVGNKSDIKLGNAKIYTVVKGNKVEEFNINILRIDEDNATKNILFEINDESLEKTTGGVVKGMSGSPIVQDGKLIGAVTHAIVNEKNKGYGIFITTMLENE